MTDIKELKNIPKYKHLYFLEVQRYIDHGFIHVGYMNRLFNCKKDCIFYYKKYNPHLRCLNAHDTYTSDWDPDTFLRYKLQTYRNEVLNIEPFDGVISDRCYREKEYTDLKLPVEVINLGKAMEKGPGSPKAEFPLCISLKGCWCYDCSMDRTNPENIGTSAYDEDKHRLKALRSSKKVRETYIRNISNKQHRKIKILTNKPVTQQIDEFMDENESIFLRLKILENYKKLDELQTSTKSESIRYTEQQNVQS
jgi:hypothetical protein